MNNRWRLPLAIFSLALAAATQADFLAGAPQSIDTPFTLNLWAAIFFQFALFLIGMRGWGFFLARGLGLGETGTGLAWALGSLFYALVAFMLGSLGWLHPDVRWLLFALNAAGGALNPPLKISVPKRAVDFVILLPLALFLLLIGMDTLVIHPYWDPLHHHLLGPRLWWEAGKIFFPPEAISAYQEGGFEMLFLWPHFFFARAGGGGLLPVQIFAQLTHAVLGFGGSLLLAQQLLKREISSPAARMVALLLFAIPASLQFGIPTAKNDWGLVLWVLAGITLLLEANILATAVAGFFFGYCLLAKFSAVYAILPVLLVAPLLLPNLRKPRPMLLGAAGFILGALPLALRNYFGAGDPFFPLFAKFFPHAALGPTWKEALAAYQAGHISVVGRLAEWAHEFLFAPLLFALPWLWRRAESSLVRLLAISIPISLLLFLFTAGAPAELRLLGSCLPISGMLAGMLLARMANRSPYPQIFSILLIGLLVIFVPFRWDALKRFTAISEPELQAKSYVGAEAQAWFRGQYQPGQKAAFLVDTRLYHSVPYPLVRIWDVPALDANLRAAASPLDFLARLRRAGYSHLILTQEKLDLFYPRALVAQVEGFALAHPEHIVFRTPFSMVVDLSSY